MLKIFTPIPLGVSMPASSAPSSVPSPPSGQSREHVTGTALPRVLRAPTACSSGCLAWSSAPALQATGPSKVPQAVPVPGQLGSLPDLGAASASHTAPRLPGLDRFRHQRGSRGGKRSLCAPLLSLHAGGGCALSSQHASTPALVPSSLHPARPITAAPPTSPRPEQSPNTQRGPRRTFPHAQHHPGKWTPRALGLNGVTGTEIMATLGSAAFRVRLGGCRGEAGQRGGSPVLRPRGGCPAGAETPKDAAHTSG